MKKLLFCMLGSALLFTACEKKPGITPNSDGVSFTSHINDASKVAANAFEDNDGIGVTAYSDAGMTAKVAENVSYVYSNGQFTSAAPIEYTGEDMAFRAVYPYQSDMAEQFTFETNVDQSVHANYSMSDLLVAETALTDDQVPNLVFDHCLTSIVIEVNESSVSLANAVVTVNAKNTVSVDLTTSSFEATGNVAAITAGANGNKSWKAIIAPQVIAAGTEFVNINVNGKDYPVVVAEDVDLASGKQFTIEGKITEAGVFVFTALINPWVDGGTINGDPQTGEYNIEQIITEITATSCVVETLITPEGSTYFCNVYAKSLYDDLGGTDEALIEAVVNAINADFLDTGDMKYSYGLGQVKLDPATDYIAVAFAAEGDNNNKIVPLSGLFIEEFRTLDAPSGGDDYEAWIGTWEITSDKTLYSPDQNTEELRDKSLTQQIVIQAGTAGETYNIYGWDYSLVRWSYPMPAAYDNGKFSVLGDNILAFDVPEAGDVLFYRAGCAVEDMGLNYIVTGSYTSLEATMNADKESGNVICLGGEVSGGYAFVTNTMKIVLERNDLIYTFNPDETLGWEADESPVGPFTMTKISNSTELQGAPAKTQGAAIMGMKFADKVYLPAMVNDLELTPAPRILQGL